MKSPAQTAVETATQGAKTRYGMRSTPQATVIGTRMPGMWRPSSTAHGPQRLKRRSAASSRALERWRKRAIG